MAPRLGLARIVALGAPHGRYPRDFHAGKGIEASMIVAILLAYLNRMGQRRYFP